MQPRRWRLLQTRLPLIILALLLGLSLVRVASAVASLRDRLPPGKQAVLDRDEADRATAIAKHIPKDPTKHGPPQATPMPTPTPRTGIIGKIQSPFDKQTEIENRWQGHVNDEFVAVLAGSRRDTPEQGFVIVMKDALNNGYTAQTYYTPTKAGGVKITAVDNLQFTLVAKNGETFVFDLASRAFVSPTSVPVLPTPRAQAVGVADEWCADDTNEA